MKNDQKEIEKVSSLDPFKRYSYLIKRIADSETVYMLVDKENNFIYSEFEDEQLIPVWSSFEFAESCLINGWEEAIIKEIPLDFFEEVVYKIIEENSYLINVFPVSDKTGFIVNLEEFSRDLNEELENYS